MELPGGPRPLTLTLTLTLTLAEPALLRRVRPRAAAHGRRVQRRDHRRQVRRRRCAGGGGQRTGDCGASAAGGGHQLRAGALGPSRPAAQLPTRPRGRPPPRPCCPTATLLPHPAHPTLRAQHSRYLPKSRYLSPAGAPLLAARHVVPATRRPPRRRPRARHHAERQPRRHRLQGRHAAPTLTPALTLTLALSRTPRCACGTRRAPRASPCASDTWRPSAPSPSAGARRRR